MPWRWDWRPGEAQSNGAGLCNCSTVSPGVDSQHSASQSKGSSGVSSVEGSDSDVCCFPYLTGNAVFPACSAAGLGFYHFVDLQHALLQQEWEGQEANAKRVQVLNAKEHHWTGELDASQVWHTLLIELVSSFVVLVVQQHWCRFVCGASFPAAAPAATSTLSSGGSAAGC